MPSLLRAHAWKTGLAVLGGACLIVLAVAGGSITGAAKAAPAGTAPPVDHQLCYTAAGFYGRVPPQGAVRLIDQFNPNGFLPQINAKANLLCNPAKKILPATGQAFLVTNPRAHLVCYQIAETDTQPVPKVIVTNQFGQALLQPGPQAISLCVPTWKSLTATPTAASDTPPGLNHFTCYPVNVLAGGYQPPTGILVRDEFAKAPVQVQVSPNPEVLCLPAEKVITTPVGVRDYPIVNPDLHLLCYPVTKTPIRNPVYTKNQFGHPRLRILGSQWLCLPSTKQVVAG